jgi:hypothetical protein
MKYTLLEMTQAVLSAMDSDDVSTITENDEAYQVALVIRAAYFDIINRANLPEHFTLTKLEETSSSTPTIMTKPTDVDTLEWIKYDAQLDGAADPDWREIKYKEMDQFLRDMYMLSPSEDDVASFDLTVGSNTVAMFYMSDRPPTCWTTFDDSTIIFDSFDVVVDTDGYLRKTKSLAYGKGVIPFTMSDGFTPDLDENQFALLLNESKTLAFAELKQTVHAEAKERARKQWTGLNARKFNVKGTSWFNNLPNYGRK